MKKNIPETRRQLAFFEDALSHPHKFRWEGSKGKKVPWGKLSEKQREWYIRECEGRMHEYYELYTHLPPDASI